MTRRQTIHFRSEYPYDSDNRSFYVFNISIRRDWSIRCERLIDYLKEAIGIEDAFDVRGNHYLQGNRTFSSIPKSSKQSLVSHSRQRSTNKFAVALRIAISRSASTCCVYGTTIRSMSSSSYLDLRP